MFTGTSDLKVNLDPTKEHMFSTVIKIPIGHSQDTTFFARKRANNSMLTISKLTQNN